MLEVSVSVWPCNAVSRPSLSSSEGALISVSVTVEPRLLEDVLEALAQLDFPINPQIYHDAALRYLYADGHEDCLSTTLVEFPAYSGRLPEIRRVLKAYGFETSSVHVAPMLDEIRADEITEAAPDEAPYVRVTRLKHGRAARCSSS
jgi:hypothetical protein